MVRSSVEETFNELLERLTQAARYERGEQAPDRERAAFWGISAATAYAIPLASASR